MRQNFGKKNYFMPLPVLIIGTYDQDNIPNAMNAAWGGIYDEGKIFICLSSDHKTTINIKTKNEFTVSFATEKYVVEADYLGIVSGHDENKIEKANLHPCKSEFVDAPYFEEFPMTLDCKVESFKDDGETTYLIADVINVSVDKQYCDNNFINTEKMNFIAYNSVNHTYVKINGTVGKAFKDGLKIK